MRKIVVLFLSFLLFSCNEINKKHTFKGVDINRAEDGSPRHHPNYDSVEKYISKIRNFDKIQLKDSTIIKFNIYSDCCQKPKDDVKYSKDTLFIFASFELGNLCDSYCDYQFEYHFSKADIKNKKIIIQ